MGRANKKLVIPAKAGIQLLRDSKSWIPAFAGMTSKKQFADSICISNFVHIA